MSPVGFEPTISAGEWPQTYALGCTATGTGTAYIRNFNLQRSHIRRMGKINLNAGLPVFYIYIYLYSKNPDLVITFGCRICQKTIYEGSM
jgi:hypothetical protein